MKKQRQNKVNRNLSPKAKQSNINPLSIKQSKNLQRFSIKLTISIFSITLLLSKKQQNIRLLSISPWNIKLLKSILKSLQKIRHRLSQKQGKRSKIRQNTKPNTKYSIKLSTNPNTRCSTSQQILSMSQKRSKNINKTTDGLLSLPKKEKTKRNDSFPKASIQKKSLLNLVPS